MKIKQLENKKIAIFGYGREGQSILRAIRRQLPEQSLTVLNDTPLTLEERKVEVCSGEAVAARLQTFDIVIKSPGISAYRPEILDAKAAGVVFSSATRLWFAEHEHAKTVCVTGTKGKSTTTSLIAHLLRAAAWQVALGGNIGTPLFDLPDEPAPDVWVLELSSYQTSDFDADPNMSVLLNLFPEHLDWHGDVDTYFQDKLNLLRQTQQGQKILNAQDVNTQAYSQKLNNCLYFNQKDGFHHDAQMIYHGDTRLLALQALPIAGQHNASNLCAALTVVQALGVDVQTCLPALQDFQSLPHRLCVLGSKNAVRYVDDSISTTPQSSLAAVQAFPDCHVTLLLGGYERGLDWTELAAFARQRPIQAIITLPDNGYRIAQILRQTQATNGLPKVFEASDLAAALAQAQAITPSGGVVILSPGAPSYGRFTNFQERGLLFAELAGFACSSNATNSA